MRADRERQSMTIHDCHDFHAFPALRRSDPRPTTLRHHERRIDEASRFIQGAFVAKLVGYIHQHSPQNFIAAPGLKAPMNGFVVRIASGASPARSSARRTPGATDNTSPRSPRSGGLRPPCSGPARPEHRPAAASQRSLQACIASLPLQSSLMSKTYLKSDHFSGGGSKEHNLRSVPQEQVLSELYTGFKHANTPAVSQQKRVTVS